MFWTLTSLNQQARPRAAKAEAIAFRQRAQDRSEMILTCKSNPAAKLYRHGAQAAHPREVRRKLAALQRWTSATGCDQLLILSSDTGESSKQRGCKEFKCQLVLSNRASLKSATLPDRKVEGVLPCFVARVGPSLAAEFCGCESSAERRGGPTRSSNRPLKQLGRNGGWHSPL